MNYGAYKPSLVCVVFTFITAVQLYFAITSELAIANVACMHRFLLGYFVFQSFISILNLETINILSILDPLSTKMECSIST